MSARAANDNAAYIDAPAPPASTKRGSAGIERTRYTPFGIAIDDNPDLTNQAGFTGHIKDAATGLNYMQARYYDPVMGRFLSIDPVTFLDNGNPGYFNRYAYANNDPVNMIDPDGQVAGAAVKLVRRTIKHKGNVVEAAFDVGGDVVTVFAPSSTPFEILESAVALVSPVDFDDAKAVKNAFKATGKKFGGRKGGLDTRAQNKAIGNNIEANGGTTTGGFADNKETQFGTGKGSRYSNGSATAADGNPFQVQTVDTKADGSLTSRESSAARDIAERGNQPVVCVSKTTC